MNKYLFRTLQTIHFLVLVIGSITFLYFTHPASDSQQAVQITSKYTIKKVAPYYFEVCAVRDKTLCNDMNVPHEIYVKFNPGDRMFITVNRLNEMHPKYSLTQFFAAFALFAWGLLTLVSAIVKKTIPNGWN